MTPQRNWRELFLLPCLFLVLPDVLCTMGFKLQSLVKTPWALTSLLEGQGFRKGPVCSWWVSKLISLQGHSFSSELELQHSMLPKERSPMLHILHFNSNLMITAQLLEHSLCEFCKEEADSCCQSCETLNLMNITPCRRQPEDKQLGRAVLRADSKSVLKGIYSQRGIFEKVCKENVLKVQYILKTWGIKCNPDGEISTINEDSIGTLDQWTDSTHGK